MQATMPFFLHLAYIIYSCNQGSLGLIPSAQGPSICAHSRQQQRKVQDIQRHGLRLIRQTRASLTLSPSAPFGHATMGHLYRECACQPRSCASVAASDLKKKVARMQRVTLHLCKQYLGRRRFLLAAEKKGITLDDEAFSLVS